MRVEGYHPALESVDVTLHNSELWREFHKMGNEMIITKTGRYVVWFGNVYCVV